MSTLDKYLQDIKKDLKALEQKVSFAQSLLKQLEKSKSLEQVDVDTIDEIKEEISPKSSAQDSLQALYDDGFHICNSFYGSKKLSNEECLLCLEMLDRGSG
jgi:regulator of replication initiation timing